MATNIKPPYWWEEKYPNISFEEQLKAFGKYLEEFYRYYRGNQTYLSFLQWNHPEIIGQFTEEAIQGMRLTQAELLGIEEKQWGSKDYFANSLN